MNQPQVRTFTHIVSCPPLTDMAEMMGVYNNLLQACQIKGNIAVPPVTGFTHPIAECQQQLQKDFLQTMQLLQTAVASYGSVTLVNARCTSSSLTFVFQYVE